MTATQTTSHVFVAQRGFGDMPWRVTEEGRPGSERQSFFKGYTPASDAQTSRERAIARAERLAAATPGSRVEVRGG